MSSRLTSSAPHAGIKFQTKGAAEPEYQKPYYDYEKTDKTKPDMNKDGNNGNLA